MRPLQAIGMGLLVIALRARTDAGFDLLPDPLGWLLVLLGVYGLEQAVPSLAQRGMLLYVGVVALVVSGALWVPAAYEWLEDADPALGWAANLPQFGFLALLCHGLAVSAASESAADPRSGAAAWLRTTSFLLVAVMVAPVLVFGAGWSDLGALAAGTAQLVMLLLMVLCFAYSGRRWAGAAPSPA